MYPRQNIADQSILESAVLPASPMPLFQGHCKGWGWKWDIRNNVISGAVDTKFIRRAQIARMKIVTTYIAQHLRMYAPTKAWLNLYLSINHYQLTLNGINQHQSASISINQHQSAPISINQQPTASISIKQNQAEKFSFNGYQPDKSASNRINQHQSISCDTKCIDTCLGT